MIATVKDLVVRATTELLAHDDVDAVDRYFAPTYIQHGTIASTEWPAPAR